MAAAVQEISAHDQARMIRAQAEAARASAAREAEIVAREEALARRAEAEDAERRADVEIARLKEAAVAHAALLEAEVQALEDRRIVIARRQHALAGRERDLGARCQETGNIRRSALAALEAAAGVLVEATKKELIVAELEQARAAAAQLVREIDLGTNDSSQGKRAKRLMGIVAGRLSGHYLTERHGSMVPIGEPYGAEAPVSDDMLRAIESVSGGIRLSLSETRDAVRIEGLDGVGREVARRCLAWLLRRPLAGGLDALLREGKDIAARLDREVVDLGQRAFTMLRIPRAHPEIVKLVGRLNFRTSYTQNQWKHAVEAALLSGMIAQELGLDRNIALRAALMHDIGKALTHELDGSHAVIGADYARRMGESEIVANAIGAHHTDEPFGSPYAYLVAACDAMSGARPGARRQMEEKFSAKLGDLERISRSFRGVAEAFAVQGGREVRVFVREDRVDDSGAVKLSSEIAGNISRDMTFPGQIRVTVIREFRAEELAN